MERTRLVAGVLLVLLIAAALIYVLVSQARDVEQPTTAAEPTASAEALSPSPGDDLTPSPEPEAEPIAVPTPDTTGRDFEHIFREIVAFRDWLFANPDPEQLRLIYHPECDCFEEAQRALESLEKQQAAIVGEPTEVDALDVVQEFESLATLDVTMTTPARHAQDARGETVNEASAHTTTYRFILVRSGARWSVRDVETHR